MGGFITVHPTTEDAVCKTNGSAAPTSLGEGAEGGKEGMMGVGRETDREWRNGESGRYGR